MQTIQSNTKVFIQDNTLDWTVVAPGVKRKIMCYDEHLMFVKVSFDKGGVGAVHQHPHSQITHVESGSFEVEIDGEKKILNAGDAYIIPSNLWHGCVCLQAGVLIDMFSPMREDFVR